jgi:hypothetical protein
MIALMQDQLVLLQNEDDDAYRWLDEPTRERGRRGIAAARAALAEAVKRADAA